METYKYVVVLLVDVDAFSDDDAREVLQDTFGTGPDGGIDIKDVTIKENK